MSNPKKLDKVYIRDLSLRCIIGIFPEERTKKQDIVINVTMEADLRNAGKTDSIEDTVDYKRITKAILAAIEPSSYNLIEKIAQVIADICFTDELVQTAEVIIDKPGALRFAKAPAVSIYRER
ncbi:dihydroneopterin aldolase [[Leptolyngbya] sp. PCC 7376]|uniref:dihydroneopterin aldolase n=1 Tax=[Leptolyngbya] sp. PCC 7376 TaxID=111781 RepID=UPI00029EF2D6|nr:dihydroneopterin aldolase [[Leptolyngbya] sp. PCC 7376]AFY37486.1 dihydroneopterin aldolase [[Leptolyngbya] sp. PCC 7376]